MVSLANYSRKKSNLIQTLPEHRKRGYTLNFIYEASIILIPKPDKDNIANTTHKHSFKKTILNINKLNPGLI